MRGWGRVIGHSQGGSLHFLVGEQGRGVGVGDIPGEAARVAGVGGGTSPEAYAPIF